MANKLYSPKRHSWLLTKSREREDAEPYPIEWQCRRCGLMKNHVWRNKFKYWCSSETTTWMWEGQVPECNDNMVAYQESRPRFGFGNGFSLVGPFEQSEKSK